LEFSDREVNLKFRSFLVNTARISLPLDNFEQTGTKSAYETTLVVLNDFLVVVADEARLEIGEVESTVIVSLKLVGQVQNYLVRML
jgi:hypothetical protein